MSAFVLFPLRKSLRDQGRRTMVYFFFFLVECTVLSGLIRMQKIDSQGILSAAGEEGAEPQVFS